MEPTLKNIDDYNKPLPKSKKRVLYTILAMVVVLGVILVYEQSSNSVVSDEIEVEQSIGKIPYK